MDFRYWFKEIKNKFKINKLFLFIILRDWICHRRIEGFQDMKEIRFVTVGGFQVTRIIQL